MKSSPFQRQTGTRAGTEALAFADPWEALSEETGKRDNWLLSYIDILTLFLTLFVVLLALQPAKEAPPAAAGRAGLVFASPEPIERQPPPPPLKDQSKPDQEPASASPLPDPPIPTVAGGQREIGPVVAQPVSLLSILDRPVTSPTGIGTAEAAVPAGAAAEKPAHPGIETRRETEQLVQRIMTSLPQQRLDERVKISPLAGGIHFEVRDNILFAPGSAELKGDGAELLNDLARLFLDQHGVISVEGHTDDRPIANTRFPSNWELSSGRANRVTRYLIGKGVDPARLRAVGYADTRPLESNTDPEGRARNRRVALIMELPGF